MEILTFGGDNFLLGKRIPREKQWVNILREELKDVCTFYQEGLPGRTAGNLNTKKTFKNGKDTFISIFKTNAPVDTIIIALGSNDLQIKYNEKSKNIIKSLLWYKEIINEIYTDKEDRKNTL